MDCGEGVQAALTRSLRIPSLTPSHATNPSYAFHRSGLSRSILVAVSRIDSKEEPRALANVRILSALARSCGVRIPHRCAGDGDD
jgi:hypothetical protein